MSRITQMLSKALPQRGPTDAPKHPQIVYLNGGVGAMIVTWNDYIQAEAALRHPVISRGINKIAESVQQARFVAVEDERAPPAQRSGKKTLIDDLQALLDSPNDNMSSPQFRYWMSINWTCYGRVPIRFGVSGMDRTRVNGMYPLEARLTKSHLDQRGAVKWYEYGQNSDTQRYDSHHTWLGKASKGGGYADQIWRVGLRGYQHKDDRNNVLCSIGLPAEVIRLLLVRAAQTAAGHPNVRYLVTTSRTLTDKQKEAVRKHLNGDHGVDGGESGKIPILNNAADVTIHKLDNDLSDIHSKVPVDDMTRMIFGALGIPIALAGLGAADAAKFAGNFKESRMSFWQDTIVPGHLTPLSWGLTDFLCPPGVCIKPDLDHVPAMQEARAQSMKDVQDIRFLTTTEKRAMFGLDPNDALPEDTSGPKAPTTTTQPETPNE